MLTDIYLWHSSDVFQHGPIIFSDTSGATECVAYIQRLNQCCFIRHKLYAQGHSRQLSIWANLDFYIFRTFALNILHFSPPFSLSHQNILLSFSSRRGVSICRIQFNVNGSQKTELNTGGYSRQFSKETYLQLYAKPVLLKCMFYQEIKICRPAYESQRLHHYNAIIVQA